MKKSLDEIKRDYNNVPVPDTALLRIQKGIEEAKMDTAVIKKNIKANKISAWKKSVGAAAAAIAVCFIALNTSGTVAHAMENIPILGKVFSVMTIREYESDNATAKVPVIEEGNGEAANTVNKAASEYIDMLLGQFEADYADYEGGYASLDIDYEVAADTDKYFSLDIVATETGASGYVFHKFYTIDKSLDKVITLSDYFKGKEFVEPISKEIISQMEKDTSGGYIYGEEDGFTKIKEDQNFYIDENGQIVIAFDEYEVAAGFMGAPKFTIPTEVTDNIK